MYATPAAIRRAKAGPLIIPPGVDFNFTDWLVGLGHVDGDIEATLPAGSTIGGSIAGQYAFDVGDISAYSSVIINIEGEVQGRGGDANGGSGSNGLVSTLPLTLNVSGAIRAGGGGGGAGGVGGSGIDFINVTENYSIPKPSSVWIPKNPDGSLACVDVLDTQFGTRYSSWIRSADGSTDVGIGYPCGYNGIANPSHTNMTWQGSFRARAVPPSGTEATDLYSIFHGETVFGTSTPGDGGKGQGYEGALESGGTGSSTSGAGKGGNGGNGGDWGVSGGAGTTGVAGNTYTDSGEVTHPNLGDFKRVTLNVPSTNFEAGAPGGSGGIDITVPASAVVNHIE